MKAVGIVFLLFGWVIVLAALALLRHPVERASFVVAGFALEMLGLSLLAGAYARTPRNAE